MRKFTVAIFGMLGLVLIGLLGFGFHSRNKISGNSRTPSEVETNTVAIDTQNGKEIEIGDREIVDMLVIAVEENAILLEPLQEEWKQRVSDRVRIGQGALDFDKEISEFQVGDLLRIVYNGSVMETYPAQLGEVFSIEKMEQTEAKIAEYHTSYTNMQLQLPSNWEYEIVPAEQSKKEENQTFGIRFWPKEDTDMKLELFYWTQGVGMCGTGVTIEKIEFLNGMSATQYTEQIEGCLWLTIIYQDLPGTYVVNGSVPEALWEKYKSIVTEILETAELGKGMICEKDAISAASEVFINSIHMPEWIYREWEETGETTGFYHSVRTRFYWEEGYWEIKFYNKEYKEIREVWLDTKGAVLNKEEQEYQEREGEE